MKSSIQVGGGFICLIAACDALFSLYHLCQYFFRLTRFNFSSVQPDTVPLYQGLWIALFAKHILQMFLSGSLFLAVRDIRSSQNPRSSIFTCQVWCGVSVIFLLTSFLDGILLSFASIDLELSTDGLGIFIRTIAEVSPSILVHTVEIIFRMCGIVTVHKFINSFLCDCYFR